MWVHNQVFFGPEKLLADTFRRMIQEQAVEFEVGALAQSVSRLENVLGELDVPAQWLHQRLAQPVHWSAKTSVSRSK